MVRIEAMTGDEIAAEAMRQINPDVVAAYPITPQTEVVQNFSQFVANGQVKTEMIRVESCLLYTSPSPRDISGSRMPSSA